MLHLTKQLLKHWANKPCHLLFLLASVSTMLPTSLPLRAFTLLNSQQLCSSSPPLPLPKPSRSAKG